MLIKKVETKDQADQLYNDSALTWEGLSEDSIEDAKNWILEFTNFKTEEITVYVTKGEKMNEFYALTGDNAYPDDLTIVSFMLSDMKDPMKLAIARFHVGGRWFDDIVDNNLRRENRDEDEF